MRTLQWTNMDRISLCIGYRYRQTDNYCVMESKFDPSHNFGYWLLQQLVLPNKPWFSNVAVLVIVAVVRISQCRSLWKYYQSRSRFVSRTSNWQWKQTVVAVSGLSDPFPIFTDEMPRVICEVTRDGCFVFDASHVSVLGRLRVSTTCRWNNNCYIVNLRNVSLFSGK